MTPAVAPSFVLVSFQVSPSFAARRSAVRVAPRKPFASVAPITMLAVMDDDSKAMSYAYAAFAVLWAAFWVILDQALPGHPWWVEVVVAGLCALISFLPLAIVAGFVAGLVLYAAPGIADGVSGVRHEAACEPRRSTRSVR